MTFEATMLVDITYYKNLDYFDQNNFYNQKHLYYKNYPSAVKNTYNVFKDNKYSYTYNNGWQICLYLLL